MDENKRNVMKTKKKLINKQMPEFLNTLLIFLKYNSLVFRFFLRTIHKLRFT